MTTDNVLNENEQLALEAIKTMLQSDTKLGLSAHDDEEHSAERGFEYLHNQIDEMFALKAAELTHSTGINAAFKKVHDYKYLDDPEFRNIMQKELLSQGVPADERTKALEIIPKIIDELKEEQTAWAEKDHGFHPELDEIIAVSQPENDIEFNIEEVEDWSDDSNVDRESGDASPGRISDNET